MNFNVVLFEQNPVKISAIRYFISELYPYLLLLLPSSSQLPTMEGSSLLTTSSSLPSFRIKTHFSFSFSLSPPQTSSSAFSHIPTPFHSLSLSLSCPRTSFRTSAFTVDQAPQIPTNHSADPLPKTDKSGRFCSPRAARELAL